MRLNEKKDKARVLPRLSEKREESIQEEIRFLGFTFKPHSTVSKQGGMFLGFDCAISQIAQTRIVSDWKKSNFHRQKRFDNTKK